MGLGFGFGFGLGLGFGFGLGSRVRVRSVAGHDRAGAARARIRRVGCAQSARGEQRRCGRVGEPAVRACLGGGGPLGW